MIPIYVISLKNSDRREAMKHQLDCYNLSFSFFDAIDGRVSNNKILQHYDNKKRFFLKASPLTKGEIGCYASHFCLWKKCIELNKEILVLEDDVIISSKILDILKHRKNLIDSYDGLFKLNTVFKVKKIKKGVIGKNLDIFQLLGTSSGARGYILTPKIAKKLVTNSDTWLHPVDDYMDKSWMHGVICYGIEPYCLKSASLPSIIGHKNRAKKKISVLSKIRREMLAIPEAILKKIYIIKNSKLN